MQEITLADIGFSYFSSFIFKVNDISLKKKKKTLQKKKLIIVEEELHGIGDLENLPRLVFIDDECGNLKVIMWRAH